MIAEFSRKAHRIWEYGEPFRERFGLLAGTRISWAVADAEYRRAPDELVEVRVPGWKNPVQIRAGSSDAEVFRQVLVGRELDLHLSPAPRRIVDGGANFGLASLVFAHRWPQAAIVAIELEWKNFQLAMKNCACIPGIDVRHAALWGHSGRVEVSNPDEDAHSYRAGPTDDEIGVRAYRIGELLDELGWDTVDLVKLDIEGAERRVLDDSAAWLPRVRHLLVELDDRFEPGCREAFEIALGGDEWNVVSQGEYMMASRIGA